MNVMPHLKFVGALVFAGTMLYFFFNLMPSITEVFPTMTSGATWIIIFALWNGLPLIVLVRETYHLFKEIYATKGRQY